MVYRKESPPAPERDRRPVIRRADEPEDLERAEKEERARVMRAESQALAAALEDERRRFDRQTRFAGAMLTLIAIGLASGAPLGPRGAALAGAGLVAGPLAALLGGQGGTRPETMPTWTRWAYGLGGVLGMILGSAALG